MSRMYASLVRFRYWERPTGVVEERKVLVAMVAARMVPPARRAAEPPTV